MINIKQLIEENKLDIENIKDQIKLKVEFKSLISSGLFVQKMGLITAAIDFQPVAHIYIVNVTLCCI